ncbi:MAG: hypothetical protein ABI835_07625 [Chloroflexota bacterium]
MRERAVATIFMWIAVATSVGLILGSLKYTELVLSPVNPSELIPQTMLVSEAWQLGAAILIFFAIACVCAVSIAIWQHPAQSDQQAVSAHQAEKTKRHTRRDREARLKRLLETMEDEDLDALEQERLGDDGERLSLETLLRKRD